jgi:hypothetical protein
MNDSFEKDAAIVSYPDDYSYSYEPLPEYDGSLEVERWLNQDDISRLAQLFGFSLSQTTVDQVNLIRNRLSFSGVVDRDYFEDDEIEAILAGFDLPRNGHSPEDLERRIDQLKNKMYQMRSDPINPYIPRTSPNASPIVAQLTMSPSPQRLTPTAPLSPSPLSGLSQPLVSLSQPRSFSPVSSVSFVSHEPGHLIPIKNRPSQRIFESPRSVDYSQNHDYGRSGGFGRNVEEFSLDEIKAIAQKLGLPTYGNRDVLIKNIRACLVSTRSTH